MKCDHCGNLNPSGTTRCDRCGAALHAKAATLPGNAAAGGGPKAAPGPPGKPPEPGAAGGGKGVGRCSICQGVFGPNDLFDVEGKTVCQDCLSRVESARRPEPLIKAPGDRKTDRAYLKEKVIADKLRAEGRTSSSTTAMWPKCHNHPNRATRDKCRVCGKSICAMCARHRVDDIYCVDCFERMSSSGTGRQSGKFSGLSTAGFDTVKEVLFSPGTFFRNLPPQGGLGRPLLFAFLNFLPGSLILLLLARFLLFRDLDVKTELLELQFLLPVIHGALLSAAGLALLGWVPFHALARLAGGKASASKGFRMFALASCFSLFSLIPPFVGIPLAAVLAATTLIRAISEVYEIGLFASFFVFVVAAAVCGGAFAAAAVFLVFPGVAF